MKGLKVSLAKRHIVVSISVAAVLTMFILVYAYWHIERQRPNVMTGTQESEGNTSSAMSADAKVPGILPAEAEQTASYTSIVEAICQSHSLEAIPDPESSVSSEEAAREADDIKREKSFMVPVLTQHDKFMETLIRPDDTRGFSAGGFEWSFSSRDHCIVHSTTSPVRMYTFRDGRCCCLTMRKTHTDHSWFYFLKGCDSIIALHALNGSWIITALEGDAALFSKRLRHVASYIDYGIPPPRETCFDFACPKGVSVR